MLVSGFVYLLIFIPYVHFASCKYFFSTSVIILTHFNRLIGETRLVSVSLRLYPIVNIIHLATSGIGRVLKYSKEAR